MRSGSARRGRDASPSDASGARRAASALTVERLDESAGEDFAAVEAIARECFSGVGFSMDEEIMRPWARLWAARVHRGAPPVGFLVAWHVADELHVLNVATTLVMRRRGIGRALMNEALGYAAQSRIRIVLLEVRRSNRAAIKLYRGLGFTAMGVRPRYYSDNDEDAVEMILAVDPDTGRFLEGRDEIRIDG